MPIPIPMDITAVKDSFVDEDNKSDHMEDRVEQWLTHTLTHSNVERTDSTLSHSYSTSD